MSYLLDTNVVREPIRAKPSANVINWLESISFESLYISVITIGELRRGIELLHLGEKKYRLIQFLEEKIPAQFEHRVLNISLEIADKWGNLNAKHKQLSAIDGLIAATALCNNLILVTRHLKHLHFIQELEILDPWEMPIS